MSGKEVYGCGEYEQDKQELEKAGLTAEEYERKVKEMCERNGF